MVSVLVDRFGTGCIQVQSGNEAFTDCIGLLDKGTIPETAGVSGMISPIVSLDVNTGVAQGPAAPLP